MRVNYGQSVHGDDEIAAVTDVLRGSTQMGKHVQQMEAGVAKLFDKRFGIMVNSGSSANYLAIELLDLPNGSEVITPALTFATTIAPIIRAGLVPSLVDVEPGTYNIDIDLLESMISPKTTAMMIPSLIGNFADWDRIRDLADRHQLKVIEDSADTLGATLRGRSTGTRSDISTTSFYGSHVINCAGNGGMICMNDPDIARKAKLLRSWGRSSSLFQNAESESIEHRFDIELDGIPYDRKFVFEELGFNMEPSEMGAAFGLVQLSKLDHNIDVRRHYFDAHLEFFSRYEEFFILPRELEEVRTGWLAFPLTVREEAPFVRRDLQIYLERADIQTRPVFTGNILRQPVMNGVAVKTNAERNYRQSDLVMQGGILLACHHGLNDDQVAYMHEKVDAFIEAKTA